MRVAAIDCGTNSIRLLIADIEGSQFREIYRTMEVVRLGEGVDQNKSFKLAVRFFYNNVIGYTGDAFNLFRQHTGFLFL